MAVRAAITAVGGYVPPDVLTNADLEQMVDTNDEWIRTRTGIRERRILRNGEGSVFMAEQAAKELIQKRGIDPEEIDVVLFATVTPDYIFPASATILADRIGATHAFGFDIEAACSSLLFAVTTAATFIETGRYNKILVVGADKMSAIVDYEDRSTCILFGDGAGCMLLEPAEDEHGIIDWVTHGDGSGLRHLVQPAGGGKVPPTIQSVQNRLHYIQQDGPAVFKKAVVKMGEGAVEVMERNGLQNDDVNYLLPHQANKRIIDATAKRMGIELDKVLMNIERYGNTTGGTIPLLMWDYERLFKKGDTIMLATFGGGYSWGAVYIKWAYDGSAVGKPLVPAFPDA